MVWIMPQVLKVWKARSQTRLMTQHTRQSRCHAEWKASNPRTGGAEPEHPGAKPMMRHVFVTGSSRGLAQQVAKPGNKGRALTLKHEGETWLQGLAASSAVTGSMDDFDALSDRDDFDNAVLTEGRDISLESPHLSTYALLHLEELYA